MKIVKTTLKDGTPVLGRAEKTGGAYPATYADDAQAEKAAAEARAAGFPRAHVRRSTLTAVVRYVVLDGPGSTVDESGKTVKTTNHKS